MNPKNFNDRFLGFPELKGRGVPYTKFHLSRLEKIGRFPRRIYLSCNRICWRESEILAWMAGQVELRDAASVSGVR